MNQSPINAISPGELLANFNGKSLKSMVIFTIVVHVALLLATSGPYIWRTVAGADKSKLSETERMELAVKETQSAMRRIAEENGIKPQDLGSHFSSPTGAPKGTPAATPNAETKPAKPETEIKTGSDVSSETSPSAPEKPESTIEKELKEAKPGPAMPTDEDLFK